MTYLILGGYGFLGQNLCRTLTRAGHKVIVYGRKSDRAVKVAEWLQQDGIPCEFLWGDFCEEKDWQVRLKDVDAVFHLISTTKPSNKDLSYEFESNVLPSVRLFEACAKEKIKVFYFSSGGTVYGVPRYLPIDELHKTDPISTYGISKLSIEKALAYCGWSSGPYIQSLWLGTGPYPRSGAYRCGFGQSLARERYRDLGHRQCYKGLHLCG